jgi:hypothetical protein
MKPTRHSIRKDNRAISPAISTVILMAAVIAMILVAMSYANNILNTKLAQNEFGGNQQFMQTAGQQMDDIAWTIGRTQTVTYSSKYGSVGFQNSALSYTFSVHSSSGWTNQTFTTGIILYNIPTSLYSMSNIYFQRVPISANSSFLLTTSSSPVSQVFCEQKVPMTDGSNVRIVLVPTLRVLSSTIAGQSSSYLKFYLPNLQNGTSPYLTQSLTLKGQGISKNTFSRIDQIQITANYPKAANGFDSSFFKFQTRTITLNSASTPKLSANSLVELYVGNVQVSIGAT